MKAKTKSCNKLPTSNENKNLVPSSSQPWWVGLDIRKQTPSNLLAAPPWAYPDTDTAESYFHPPQNIGSTTTYTNICGFTYKTKTMPRYSILDMSHELSGNQVTKHQLIERKRHKEECLKSCRNCRHIKVSDFNRELFYWAPRLWGLQI